MFPRMVEPQSLDKCSQTHLSVLYEKASLAFQNVSGQEYFEKIRTFLGESRHTWVGMTGPADPTVICQVLPSPRPTQGFLGTRGI